MVEKFNINMNPIFLEKGIIYHMLPFRFAAGSNFSASFPENEVWTKSEEPILGLDFLLEHVKQFFIKNVTGDKTDDSACLVMSLKKDSLTTKIFNNKTYWLSNIAFDKHGDEKKVLKLKVYFDPVSFRLIFHPFSRVGILLFSTELVKAFKNNNPPDLDDFIRMNYLLRLFNRHDEAFVLSHNEREEERRKASQLATIRISAIFDNHDDNNFEFSGWRPRHLVNYLLQDFNSLHKVEFFDHSHFSPICFVQPTEEIKDDALIRHALFLLRKVYDFDYTPAAGNLENIEELIHPFRQIYYAASLEGAVVFNNCGPSDPEFIRTFFSNSFRKSLWLTILAVLQRSIFLQLMKEVSAIDPDDHQMVKEYLRRYTTISLKAIFSKVSIFHQHNDYYDLLINNLQINELKTELKEELTGLNNLQRQVHEDEVERHEEVEKQYDKKLNLTLLALSIFGLTQISYAVLGNLKMPLFMHILSIGIPLVLGIVFWKVLSVHKR